LPNQKISSDNLLFRQLLSRQFGQNTQITDCPDCGETRHNVGFVPAIVHIMLIRRNPDQDKLAELIEMSEANEAKWIKDLETGDTIYWPSEEADYATVAELLKIKKYEKGIAAEE
jgi:hypothetical protein